MSDAVAVVKERVSIVDIVRGYVELSKAGINWKGRCPFHSERTPSFVVNAERGTYHCFGCGKGGDAFSFLMEVEHVSFREALEELAKRTNVNLDEYRKNFSPKQKEQRDRDEESRDRGLEMLALATRFYSKQLASPGGQKLAGEYLKSRGLTDESIQRFQLGFAPDGWEHLKNFLLTQGFVVPEMERYGLLVPGKSAKGFDRFRNRIMFPLCDALGRVVGFTSRVLPGAPDTEGKYVNTPETPIYHKSKMLYGLPQAKDSIRKLGRALLVEGNMDVIVCHQVGITNVVAVSGTALTLDHLRILKRSTETLDLFFDMDSAGQKAAFRSTLLALQAGFRVYMVAIPEGKDAADMGIADPDGLKGIIATPVAAVEYFIGNLASTHDLSTPEGKDAYVQTVAPLIKSIPSPLIAEEYVRMLCMKTGLSTRGIEAMIRSFVLPDTGAYDSGDAAAPAPTTLARSTTRTGVLSEYLIGCLVALGQSRGSVMSFLTESVRQELSSHPLWFFLQQGGDILEMVQDEALRSLAIGLSTRILSDHRFQSLVGEKSEAEILLHITNEYSGEFDAELSKVGRLSDEMAKLTAKYTKS